MRGVISRVRNHRATAICRKSVAKLYLRCVAIASRLETVGYRSRGPAAVPMPPSCVSVRPPSDDATIEETAVNTTQLVSEFVASNHGAQALQALGAQGVSDADARDLLSHATGAAVV